MLNPSRPLIVAVAVIALAGLFLGLGTDVGLLGWAAAALLAIYLSVVGAVRLASRQ